jgi:hypothetical protein
MIAMDKIDRMELYTIETLVSSSSALSDFAIYTLQDFSKQFKHLKDPHRHDFYSMIIFEKGQGEHMIDFVHYDIKGNRFFNKLWSGSFMDKIKRCQRIYH